MRQTKDLSWHLLDDGPLTGYPSKTWVCIHALKVPATVTLEFKEQRYVNTEVAERIETVEYSFDSINWQSYTEPVIITDRLFVRFLSSITFQNNTTGDFFERIIKCSRPFYISGNVGYLYKGISNYGNKLYISPSNNGIFEGSINLKSARYLDINNITGDPFYSDPNDISTYFEFPATYMFKDCTGLEYPPEVLTWDWPGYMFAGCTALKALPKFNNWPSRTNSPDAMTGMFYNSNVLLSATQTAECPYPLRFPTEKYDYLATSQSSSTPPVLKVNPFYTELSEQPEASFLFQYLSNPIQTINNVYYTNIPTYDLSMEVTNYPSLDYLCITPEKIGAVIYINNLLDVDHLTADCEFYYSYDKTNWTRLQENRRERMSTGQKQYSLKLDRPTYIKCLTTVEGQRLFNTIIQTNAPLKISGTISKFYGDPTAAEITNGDWSIGGATKLGNGLGQVKATYTTDDNIDHTFLISDIGQ